jgi:predicted transcriptional regulator
MNNSKLWRKIKDWEWYKNSETLHLFLHLLINANYQDCRFMGHEIKRGSLASGRKMLSEETGISEQTIRTSLDRLKSTNEITIKPTRRFSIITLCKYEDYQGDVIEINQAINQTTNHEVTTNQPRSNQEVTTIEELKKGRKKERKNILHSFENSPFYDFEKFKTALDCEWSDYEISDYYQRAIDYSETKGGKFLDWIKAVKVWKRRDKSKKTNIQERISF